MPSPGSRHDDTLKIRLPSELKAELENAAAEDEETDSLSETAGRPTTTTTTSGATSATRGLAAAQLLLFGDATNW